MGRVSKNISCDTRICDPSCHSVLRAPAQDHGEDFTSDARSCLTPTSKVWLLNENTKSIFGWCERRLSVATFLEVTSGDSSLPTSSTASHVKTMILLYADPIVLTRATSVDASVNSTRPRTKFHHYQAYPSFVRLYGADNDVSAYAMPLILRSRRATWLMRLLSLPKAKNFVDDGLVLAKMSEHFMTYKIFADDAQRTTHRSNIRSATDPHARNLCLYLLNDEVIRLPRKSSPTSDHGEDFSLHSAEPADESSSECLTNGDNAGRTFLMDTQENGQGSRARVVERISEREPNAQRIPERESNAHRSGDHVKFRVPVSKDKHEETTKSSELKESSGSADHPITAVPDRVGLFGDATVEDDDEYISRLFPDLAEFVLDLQSNLERSIAEMLANDKFIALPDSASPFRSSLVRSNDLSELAPSSDLPSLSSARMLPSATARNQLSGSSKAFDVDNDCAVIAAPDTDSFNNKFSYENATNLRSLMGSIVIRKHFHSSCLQLKAPSDSDAAVLPFDRGPSKLLAASNGSLRLLPFDRGPCLLLTALRIITRLFFQLSEVMEPVHLRTPYSPAKTQQVSFRMMILLSILLLDIPLTGIYLFDICTSTSSVMDHELMGSDRNYTALRTHVQWSVRLSSLLIT